MLLKGSGRKMNFNLYNLHSNGEENICGLSCTRSFLEPGNIKEHEEEVGEGGHSKGWKQKGCLDLEE